MGLFLAASGVIGADCDAVVRSVSSFVVSHGGHFESQSEATFEENTAVISEGNPNTTILYPRGFLSWDELSQHLSKELHVPVFSFHIHDGDLWMFLLFNQGEKVTQFNTIPSYWDELDATEKASWLGDAEAVSKLVPGVTADSIKNYFVEWTEDVADGVAKAYPDDEFAYGTDWQLTDFMRRVGLKYPVHPDGGPDGRTFHMRIRRGRKIG